jgi:hypothetical protein
MVGTVIKNGTELLQTLKLVFPDGIPPSPLHILFAAEKVRRGAEIKAVAAEFRTTVRRIQPLVDNPDDLLKLLKEPLPEFDEDLAVRPRRNIGQLILGGIAEHAFEEIYKTNMGTNELVLQDERADGSDTDYVVINGSKRAIFRVNIKFFGSQFQKAFETVGLQPDDCFALATYKINAALLKQKAQKLQYLFLIVGVPDLKGAVVGQDIPEDLVHLAIITSESEQVRGKRLIEDAIVTCLRDRPVTPEYAGRLAQYYDRIMKAPWFVISAGKALRLLRDKLFDRCFALSMRGFAKNWKNAEVDMHFSLKQDLLPLSDFFTALKQFGLVGTVTRIEREEI